MIGIIALALSILVMISGLYLLARSKKDSLGNLYVFSSYAAIALGALMFAGTVVGGACMMHHRCKAESSCHMKAEGGQCQMNSGCAHMQGNSAGKCGSHAGFGHGGGACGHGGMKASCGHGMEKMGSCKMHKEMIIEKTVVSDNDDDEDEGEGEE